MAVVDIARTDVCRIEAAPVVVGIIVGEIVRADRQVERLAAATMLDLNQITGSFTVLQKGL